MIRAIVAIDDKRGIAAPNNQPYNIPWDIPADRSYYKQQTLNSTVVMGRATYDTLTAPLPYRRNVVVSRNLKAVRKGFERVASLEEFLQQAKSDDIWIIGGADIYHAALPYCEELYITHVTGDFNCDRFFPNYQADFRLRSKSKPEQQNGYVFYYAIYTKNR